MEAEILKYSVYHMQSQGL